MDDESNNDTNRLVDLLKAGYLTKHVEVPTRVAGHTVDLLITHSSDAFLNNIRIHIPHLSDYSAISCKLRLAKPPTTQVATTSRRYKHVSITAMYEDIRSLLLSMHLPDDTNYAVDMYDETIGAIVDIRAPLTRRTMTIRPHTS